MKKAVAYAMAFIMYKRSKKRAASTTKRLFYCEIYKNKLLFFNKKVPQR